MEWFVEEHDGTAFMVRYDKKLYEGGKMQRIEIYSTSMGKMLVLDGKIQFTEADEFIYHEMLVHVPMLLHPNPRKVLIIGGGDGGGVREVLKHSPDEITMVEIDRMVVEKCREYIGIDAGALDDDRVNVIYEDGMKFVEETEERYDVLIIDGTDPNMISQPLETARFFERCHEISDVFSSQTQSPFFQKDYFRAIVKNSSHISRKFYISYMPSYPSGMWSFMLSSRIGYEADIERRIEERGIKTRHYNASIHHASFALPEWMKEMLNEG